MPYADPPKPLYDETDMAKAFASQADLEAKQVTFTKLSDNAYAYTAEGDPNSGVIIGDDGVIIVDTTATPAMAQDLIAKIRSVTDKPIKYVVLSHYHAVRVLGASAYEAENIYASRNTYDLIVERGAEDMQSEMDRFPRLFRGADSVPGLTWPTLVFGDGQPGRAGGIRYRRALARSTSCDRVARARHPVCRAGRIPRAARLRCRRRELGRRGVRRGEL